MDDEVAATGDEAAFLPGVGFVIGVDATPPPPPPSCPPTGIEAERDVVAPAPVIEIVLLYRPTSMPVAGSAAEAAVKVMSVGVAIVVETGGTAPLGLANDGGGMIGAVLIDEFVNSLRIGRRCGVDMVHAWMATADVAKGNAAAKPDTGEIASRLRAEGRNERVLRRGVRMEVHPARRRIA